MFYWDPIATTEKLRNPSRFFTQPHAVILPMDIQYKPLAVPTRTPWCSEGHHWTIPMGFVLELQWEGSKILVDGKAKALAGIVHSVSGW